MTRILAALLAFAIIGSAYAQLLHGVTDSLSGGGSPAPPAHQLLAQTGVAILAQTNSPILVQ